MSINIEFLVVCYFVGLFIDWVFQHELQAVHKSKWDKGDNYTKSWMALFTHSITYAALTTIITFIILTHTTSWLISEAPLDIILTFIVLYISHIIIDSRIPVKWIMRLKGLTEQQIGDYKNYGFLHVGIDHRLHEIVILILAFFV